MVLRLLVSVDVMGVVLVGGSPNSGDASAASTTAVGAATGSSSSSDSSSTTSATVDPVVAVSETFEALSAAPSEAVVPGLAGSIDDEVALPAGAVVTPMLETLQVDGSIAEVMAEVELADGTVDRFAVVMVAVGDRWLIAYTVKAP